MKFIAQRIIPRVVDRKLLPWPTVVVFSHAVYSVIADHSGLCLDILNGSTDNSAVYTVACKRREQSAMGVRAGS